MNKIEQLLACDLGNGETCWKTYNNEGRFRSLIAPAGEQVMSTGDEIVTVGKKRYLVGDSCASEMVETGSTDSSYYSSERIKILFLSVLERAGIKNPVLITGLPTEFHESHKADFEQNLKKWAREANYQIDGLKILPQHYGPIMDPSMRDEDGNSISASGIRGTVGIIDIGQGTIDVGQVYNGKANQQNWGENKGVSDIHKAVLQQFKNPPQTKKRGKAHIPEEISKDKQLNVQRINTYFREGYVPFKGEQLDIWAMTKEIRKDFAEQHLGRAISEMWGTTATLDGMIVAGGGAIVLGREILEEVIKCPILIPEDPSMSIVNGFYALMARVINKAA